MSFEEQLLKKLKLLVLPVLILAVAVGALWHWLVYRQKPQPIAFSHVIHAGDRQISCVFCHTGVTHGNNAGVPSVQDCMQCHQVVASDRPEIKKLHESYWKDGKGKPIEWFKVYNMPGHVRFSHKAHIKAGVSCTTCHGDVAGMSTVSAANNFTMGKCVGCHRENNAPTDCTTCHQ